MGLVEHFTLQKRPIKGVGNFSQIIECYSVKYCENCNFVKISDNLRVF